MHFSGALPQGRSLSASSSSLRRPGGGGKPHSEGKAIRITEWLSRDFARQNTGCDLLCRARGPSPRDILMQAGRAAISKPDIKACVC